MTDLYQRLREDRQMRDSARAVLLADLEHARSSFSAKGVAGRFGERISEGAMDVFETAKVHSEDNRGIIAALMGAILLWFGRGPILDLLGLSNAEGEGEISEEDPAQEPVSDTTDNIPFGDEDEH